MVSVAEATMLAGGDVLFDENTESLMTGTDKADGMTEPGVSVGSSSMFFRLLPFQGLPGSNSGTSNEFVLSF
jgi:hypothetical protein